MPTKKQLEERIKLLEKVVHTYDSKSMGIEINLRNIPPDQVPAFNKMCDLIVSMVPKK